ncbi:hypothetical protein [Streptomyces thermolilacinus]|uniref:Uncharacterized protein n=1 Tax=Streptomyces thermolilacinus SPC6 TaxID=1306406 RepID=A0A1D3DQS5_9ACTN|nr:hypothetical protein [Streptomyces thermolilacinus]OEJ94669.1 hypothetical protein J116_009495 [Streptomyces thermolilacinus SPC6]
MAVFATSLLLVGCTAQPSAGARAQGTALFTESTMSSGTAGTEKAAVGQEWWFALPVPHNTSDETIRITGAHLVSVPRGLDVSGYGAFEIDKTGGVYLLSNAADSSNPRFTQLENHIGRPVEVRPRQASGIYYLARLRITGPVEGNVRGCRYEYEQGSRLYTQTLDCEAEIRTAARQRRR